MILNISYLEWFGYLGSIVVAISLTMSSIIKLRWFNLLGATIFSVYGFAITALPVGFLNLFIVLADIYYLIKIYSNKETFKVVVTRLDEPYVQFFLDFYKAEISNYFPDVENYQQHDQNFTFLLMRNSVVAGIFSGFQQNNLFHVAIDFVTPEYRDFKSGTFIYSDNIQLLRDLGISQINAETANSKHQSYLKRMGFVSVNEKTSIRRFTKQI